MTTFPLAGPLWRAQRARSAVLGRLQLRGRAGLDQDVQQCGQLSEAGPVAQCLEGRNTDGRFLVCGGLEKAASRPGDVPLPDDLDRQAANLGVLVRQHGQDCGGGVLAGEAAQAGSRGCGQVSRARERQVGQQRQGRGVTQMREVVDSGQADGAGALRGQGQQGGPSRRVASVAQGVDEQDLLVGGQLGQLSDKSGGDLRAGQFHGHACGGGRQHVVRAADGLEQQGDACLLACEDGAAKGRHADLLRRLRQPAELVVDRLRRNQSTHSFAPLDARQRAKAVVDRLRRGALP